jgi:hypothetical protein
MQHRDTFLQNATKKELIKYFQLVNRLAQKDAQTYGKILANDLHQYGGSLFNSGQEYIPYNREPNQPANTPSNNNNRNTHLK